MKTKLVIANNKFGAQIPEDCQSWIQNGGTYYWRVHTSTPHEAILGFIVIYPGVDVDLQKTGDDIDDIFSLYKNDTYAAYNHHASTLAATFDTLQDAEKYIAHAINVESVLVRGVEVEVVNDTSDGHKSIYMIYHNKGLIGAAIKRGHDKYLVKTPGRDLELSKFDMLQHCIGNIK